MLGPDAAEARAELLACVASGERMYAIVGPSWGKDQADAELLRAPRLLLRRVPEVPASGIHSASGARLWVGGRFALRLDDSQASALRQTFLRLFWHEAMEEAWSGGRQFVWRPVPERPFDIPEVPALAPVRWERPDAQFTSPIHGALLHLTGGVPPDAVPRRLWFPAGPDHQERLSRLTQAGAEVLWEKRDLPDLLVAGGVGEVLLPGSRGRLRIRLAAGQAGEFSSLLEAKGAWRFQTNIRIDDPAIRQSLFWLPGEASERGPEAEQAIRVPDVSATTLRVVPETAPGSFPAAQPLALAVRYQWTVIPPRLPGGTEEDALVGRWQKLDRDWTERLSQLRKTLEAAESDRGRIGRAFSQLVSAMLGFERTHGGLLSRVAELEAQRPSVAGPTGAPALLARLTEVEEQAKKLQGDLGEAERKAHEDEERKKQRDAWQKRQEEWGQALNKGRKEITEAEKRHQSLEEELQTTRDSLKSADEDTTKDLLARQSKHSDEHQRASKEVSRHRTEIASLEQQIAVPFEFRPPAQITNRSAPSGGRFVPSQASLRSTFQVPEEALPVVGLLRSQGGQRYLVIQTWEELAAGEQAAARLSAKLVAPENT
jgi:hypothetical protein